MRTGVRLIPEPRPTNVTRDGMVSVPIPGTSDYFSDRKWTISRGTKAGPTDTGTTLKVRGKRPVVR